MRNLYSLDEMRTFNGGYRVFNMWDAQNITIVEGSTNHGCNVRELGEGLWMCREGDAFQLTFQDHNGETHVLEYFGSGWFALDGGDREQH